MSAAGDVTAEKDLRSLDLGAYCGDLRGLLLAPTSIRTRNSIIVRAVKPSTGEQFAIKRVRSAERATLEFESLSRLAGLLPATANVARPVCLVAEHGVLVAEWIDGRSVHSFLVDTAASPQEVYKSLEASGRWLRDFHAVDAQDPAPLDLSKRLAQFDELCRALAHRPFRRRVLYWMQRRLVADAQEIAARALPQAELHGDFKPENLLIDGDRVVGIDVGHLYHSCVWNDVGYFLAQMEWAVLSRPNLKLAWRIGALRRAFLQAYGAADADGDVLAWIQREVLFRLAYKHLCRERLGPRQFASLVLILALFVAHALRKPRERSQLE